MHTLDASQLFFLQVTVQNLSALIPASLILSLTIYDDLKQPAITSKRSFNAVINMSHKYHEELKTAKHYKKQYICHGV